MEDCCDLEVDINGQETFLVNKNIVAHYSSKFIKLFGKNSGPNRKLKVIFHDFPGGASGFELVLRFCYNNGKYGITPFNLFLAHSAAKFMEMKESVDGKSPNLLEQTEKSLQEIGYWTWSNLLAALKQCQDFTLVAGCSTMMLEKCLESIVGRLVLTSEASPCPSSCSSESSGHRCSSDSKSIESTKTAFSRSTWWFEDLMFLSPLLVQMLVKSMLWRKLDQVIISRFLMYYQKAKFSSATTDEKRKIIEMVIDMHYSMDPRVLSCKTLFGILRITLNLNISKFSKNKLENMIGAQLDQATLDNLLVPSPYGINYLYDVNLVLRFLKAFLLQGTRLIAPSRMKKVASFIDLYIAEIAPDPYLKTSKFLALASALPDSARDSYDELYHAMDMYLEVHADLSEEERLKICSVLNYEKLSAEACQHLSQNRKFPSKSAVKALMVQQSKLKNLILGIPNAAAITISPRSSSDTDRRGTRHRIKEQAMLYTGEFDVPVQDKKFAASLQGMKWRVAELENICRKLQTQMAKIMKSRVSSGHGYSRSLPKLCS
ncbi:BTB/POZ domain-containing protein At3g22104-like isoform X1 [Prosopis cineraria]|uniref:BTB/POZ domain-containing protein At3g22104-like isoform X1 n=1 Tax=Prosopis cineraria TaxID=364024 RepID=UPI0024108DFB|nr:BTB/POZ domain-containing protein At3g22104-like isoform X1 [Prosopis cineraria]